MIIEICGSRPAIKQTIQRTSSDPVLIDLLREAVRRGKEVTAVVGL